MRPIMRRALLVIAGFCLGVATTIGALFYLIRHPETFERIVRSAISGDGSLVDLARRLAKSEAALAAASGEYHRWTALGDAALLTAQVGSPEKARRYSEELLKTATKYQRDWNFGNAVHKGNLALGLVALKSGDVGEAKRYLLEAGANAWVATAEQFRTEHDLGEGIG